MLERMMSFMIKVLVGYPESRLYEIMCECIRAIDISRVLNGHFYWLDDDAREESYFVPAQISSQQDSIKEK